MVPCVRTTQLWPLRPWRSHRKMYVVIYWGALRRRIRRVRLRVFNNARTAIRNLDLPLAIGVTPSLPSSSYCTGGFWPVHGGHSGGFSPPGTQIAWGERAVPMSRRMLGGGHPPS